MSWVLAVSLGQQQGILVTSSDKFEFITNQFNQIHVGKFVFDACAS